MIFTNTAKGVYDAIEAVAATASKLEKEQILKSAATPLLMKVLRAAYDPLVTYGVAAMPGRTEGIAPGANKIDEPMVWNVINGLATRALTGNAARDEIQKMIDFLDEPSAVLFRRIVLKDMRAGFTEGTVNRVFPGTFPEFPYMRCSLPAKSNMAKFDWDKGIVSQEKADGMFLNTNVTADGVASLHSRQGNIFPLDNLQKLKRGIEESLNPGTQTHGELIVIGPDGKVLAREIGNGMLNAVQQGGALDEGCSVKLMVWDQIPMSSVVAKGKCEVPYDKRLCSLVNQLRNRNSNPPVELIPTKIVRSVEAAYAHYRELLALGKEGTVIKSLDTIWKDGTSKDQVKLKLEVDVELRIKGFVPGTPGTKTEATFGSLLCGSACDLLEVAVAGLTDAQRQMIHNERERFLDKIITVRGNAIMKPSEDGGLHSIFLPRLIEIREDKLIADDLEQIQAIYDAAAGIKKITTQEEAVAA